MHRLLFSAFFLLVLAAPSPAMAGSASDPFYAHIGRNFVTGARYYVETVGGWAQSLFGALGLRERFARVPENGTCTQKTRCASGLACLNTCEGDACDRFEKRCVKGPREVSVLGEASACNGQNLCADGTDCRRVCPLGSACTATHRCLKPYETQDSCVIDAECRAACAKLASPEIGPSGWIARCAAGSCACDPFEISPTAPRVPCPSESPSLACPEGTQAACAAGKNGTPFATCLTAPEYGGTCFADAECSAAGCPEGAQPFCGEGQACKCRIAAAISCTNATDCPSDGCLADETVACISGTCACARPKQP